MKNKQRWPYFVSQGIYMAIKDILLVDDENDLREVLVAMISEEGYHCREASNGLEAIKILESTPVDLLITDFRMPRMNGVELLNWLREKDIHIPVLFVTANVELLPQEVNALRDCCANLLYKPLGMDDLFRAIHDAEIRQHNRDRCLEHQRRYNQTDASENFLNH